MRESNYSCSVTETLGATRGRKSYEILWICNQCFDNFGGMVDHEQCTSGHLNCRIHLVPAEYIWYQYNSDCPSYNIRTQRGVKRQCTLTYIFYERSTLNANVSVSPRTLCLHDERNARKNCEVKTSRLVYEQPLTSIFPCADSIRFIVSALNSAHDSPPESIHLSPT